jgi:hypothetical protein
MAAGKKEEKIFRVILSSAENEGIFLNLFIYIFIIIINLSKKYIPGEREREKN